jgi:hypothetical protein
MLNICLSVVKKSDVLAVTLFEVFAFFIIIFLVS